MKMNERQYVIVDPNGNFYSHDSGYIPAIVNDFTDELDYAMKFANLGDAFKCWAVLKKRLYKFDGNTPVEGNYLGIAKVEIVRLTDEARAARAERMDAK